MDEFSATLLGIIVLLLITGGVFAVRAGRAGRLAIELDAAKQDLRAARDSEGAALQAKVQAETQLEGSKHALDDAASSMATLNAQLDEARVKTQDAEKAAALALQETASIKERMGDWEKAKEGTIEAAKAATLVTAGQLIEHHQRETAAAKEENEKRVKETTEGLSQQMVSITKTVASLNDQVTQSRDTIDTVKRALSSPGGAGYFAEIGLENTLKSFGLEPERDFVMRRAIEDGEDGVRLIPDAVVFLPGDSTLVVDSKASKFLLELAEAEGTDEEDRAYERLAGSMNEHLKGLASKDYKSAIAETYRRAGRGREVHRILSVMYLPNEGAIEKLHRGDTEFARKAAEQKITLAGPVGLASLIGFARIEIDFGKQAEHQEEIVQATQKLLETVYLVVENSAKVGRGIKSAARSFAALRKTLNRSLSRSKVLVDYGVRPTANRALPNRLGTYEIFDADESGVIEGEVEDVSGAPILTNARENAEDE